MALATACECCEDAARTSPLLDCAAPALLVALSAAWDYFNPELLDGAPIDDYWQWKEHH